MREYKTYKLWELCNFDRRFAGVERAKQEDVLNFKHISAKKLREYKISEDGEVSLLSTGDYSGKTNYDNKDRNINFGEVITIPTGGTANIKYHKGYFIDSGNILFSSKNEDIVLTKYIYYYLVEINELIQSRFRGAGVQHPAMPEIIEFDISVPSIEVQSEIVRILDDFMMLEAELEAELEARITQYEYYRDELLTFDDSVERKSLRKLGELIRGVGLQKKHLLDDGVPAVHYGQIYTYYGMFADKTLSFVSKEYSKKLRKAQKGDILISGVSESIEDICTPVGWFGDEVCISGDMFAFRHNQNTKFITYMLKTTDFSRYKEKYAQGAKVTRLSRDRLLDYKIPVPSLEEQERIVSMLDKFSSLVTDIKEGLPAEIGLRRQQYEYYRNKLLTFESEV